MSIDKFALHAKTCAEYIPCNTSGVIFTFAEWMRYACDIGMSQKERNEHPITKGFLIGLHSMYGSMDDIDYLAVIERLNSLALTSRDQC